MKDGVWSVIYGNAESGEQFWQLEEYKNECGAAECGNVHKDKCEHNEMCVPCYKGTGWCCKESDICDIGDPIFRVSLGKECEYDYLYERNKTIPPKTEDESEYIISLRSYYYWNWERNYFGNCVVYWDWPRVDNTIYEDPWDFVLGIDEKTVYYYNTMPEYGCAKRSYEPGNYTIALSCRVSDENGFRIAEKEYTANITIPLDEASVSPIFSKTSLAFNYG